jgi:hypothetical protein
MATQLKLAALAITREILKDQLYDWIMRVSAAVGPLPFITGIGPFDTVARTPPTGGTRMLDASEAGLTQVPNGTAVWVESFPRSDGDGQRKDVPTHGMGGDRQ